MPDANADAPKVDVTVCNCLAIRQAARHVTQIYDRYLSKAGLRTAQYSILTNLSRRGPLSINELAAIMVMDRTTMGRAIRPLERDKLVAIGTGKEDARTRVVRVTPAGLARLKDGVVRWQEAQRAFEKAYGAGDAEELRHSLARVVAAT